MHTRQPLRPLEEPLRGHDLPCQMAQKKTRRFKLPSALAMLIAGHPKTVFGHQSRVYLSPSPRDILEVKAEMCSESLGSSQGA